MRGPTPPALPTEPTADGVKLRHDALAALRRQGATASGVADLLTRTFPSDTSGVPVYVEKATYEGKPAVLVVEAAGPKAGSLNAKRLWVVGDRRRHPVRRQPLDRTLV